MNRIRWTTGGLVFGYISACILLSGCPAARVRPQADELYEARLGTGQGMIQIVTTRWSDGSYRDTPIVQFRDGQDNSSWVVACPGGRPDSWRVVHIDEYQTPETLQAAKSMTLPQPWIYKLRVFPLDAGQNGAESKPKPPRERF